MIRLSSTYHTKVLLLTFSCFWQLPIALGSAFPDRIGPYTIFRIINPPGSAIRYPWGIAFIIKYHSKVAENFRPKEKMEALLRDSGDALKYFTDSETSAFVIRKKQFLSEPAMAVFWRKQEAMNMIWRDSHFKSAVDGLLAVFEKQGATGKDVDIAVVINDRFYWQTPRSQGLQWTTYHYLSPPWCRKPKAEGQPSTAEATEAQRSAGKPRQTWLKPLDRSPIAWSTLDGAVAIQKR